MEKLVSSWSNGKTLPENYVFPPGKRPGELVALTSKTVPVIDLGKADGDDHSEIVQQIMEAAQDFGFFQVINHGVPRKLMDDARGVFKEFFELPAEEKSRFCSRDYESQCVLYSSSVEYDREELHLWRDALKLSCTPLEECMKYWPDKPAKYREVAGEYTIKVTELGSRLLELIGEGLGLETGYFENELSQEPIMMINHYPPCPDPSLTLGTGKHCDPNLITILLQDNIPGLQVLKDGEWLGVEPIPDAFVVNMGHQIQIVSNGKLRSVEHRVVTNAEKSRTSAAFFISPTEDCLVEPAKAVLTAENPALYKGVRYEEFFKAFRGAYRDKIDHVVEIL